MPPPGTVGTRLRNSSRRATRTPGVPGPPMNLWGQMKTASRYARGSASSARVHLDRHVRCRRGEVPERECPVPWSRRAALRVGEMPVTLDAAQNEPIRAAGRHSASSSALELGQVDVAVGVLVDRHDVGDGLPPGQLVAVVLVRADEDHRPLVARDAGAQVPAVVEVGGEPQVQDVDHPVDRRRGARAAEDHGVALRRPPARWTRGVAPPHGNGWSGGRCPDDSVWVFAYSGSTASRR